MPRHKGVFVPHPHCIVLSGDCFNEGKCLRECTAQKRETHEKRIRDLEHRLLELERSFYQLRHNV